MERDPLRERISAAPPCGTELREEKGGAEHLHRQITVSRHKSTQRRRKPGCSRTAGAGRDPEAVHREDLAPARRQPLMGEEPARENVPAQHVQGIPLTGDADARPLPPQLHVPQPHGMHLGQTSAGARDKGDDGHGTFPRGREHPGRLVSGEKTNRAVGFDGCEAARGIRSGPSEVKGAPTEAREGVDGGDASGHGVGRGPGVRGFGPCATAGSASTGGRKPVMDSALVKEVIDGEFVLAAVARGAEVGKIFVDIRTSLAARAAIDERLEEPLNSGAGGGGHRGSMRLYRTCPCSTESRVKITASIRPQHLVTRLAEPSVVAARRLDRPTVIWSTQACGVPTFDLRHPIGRLPGAGHLFKVDTVESEGHRGGILSRLRFRS